MANQLPSNKLQVVFLINNYHEVRNRKEREALLAASGQNALLSLERGVVCSLPYFDTACFLFWEMALLVVLLR